MEKDIRIRTFKNFVGELTAIYKRTELPKVKISSSRDASKFIYPFYDKIMDDHEELKVIHLDNNNQVVNIHHVSSGTDNAALVSVRDIMRHAFLIKTNSIILVHNHPSGNLAASEADKKMTKKIKEAGLLLEMPLIDHLIVTRESYLSFADEGLL